MPEIIQALLHIDVTLVQLTADYGVLVYVLLFIVVFCETGLVVTPFLPGDSLLFAAGALAALDSLDVWLLALLFTIAAIAGDALNYGIGRRLGPAVFSRESGRFFRREHLEKSQRFYERHGRKTIILSRFVPIVRTFAPFLAGVARMQYREFVFYNVAGAIAWVGVALSAGYFFGNIPIVRENFSIAILLIVIASLLPGIFELFRNRNVL